MVETLLAPSEQRLQRGVMLRRFSGEASRAHQQDARYCTRDPSSLKALGMTPAMEPMLSAMNGMG